MYSLTQTAEDYLEAILNVSLEKGYAKTRDVANELEVSPSSVVEMFRKLDVLALVEYRRYEGVVLTPRGREIAEVIKFRHDTLKNFFLLIDVPEEVADKDACTMEHELSGKSITQIRLFLDYIGSGPSREELVRDFLSYCKTRPKD
jgi:DtxR family Mn-dependent transcriptional regulator